MEENVPQPNLCGNLLTPKNIHCHIYANFSSSTKGYIYLQPMPKANMDMFSQLERTFQVKCFWEIQLHYNLCDCKYITSIGSVIV
jgi:hypothetical protein